MHYSQSGHTFAMDLTSQRVWDYAGDGYVHRLMQDQADGKLVELTPSRRDEDGMVGVGSAFPEDGSGEDWVPMAKLERLGQEYTNLLTSQLESQRAYFEAQLKMAADKASDASSSAKEATKGLDQALTTLNSLQEEHRILVKDTLPSVEKERDRAVKRAENFEKLSQRLEKEWREEKAFSRGLRERVEGLGKEVEGLKEEVKGGKEKVEELREENRDLLGFISAGERIKALGDDVQGGTVGVVGKEVVGEGAGKGKGKKKGKK